MLAIEFSDMTEFDKSNAFYHRLVEHEHVEAQSSLSQRLSDSKSQERTLRRATGAVAVLGLASVCGIAYAFLFEPSLRHSAPIIFKLFYITGLASLICLTGFLFLWASSRSDRRHLIDECRRSILATIDHAENQLASSRVLDEVDHRKAA